jgi:hypothetical protein
LIKWKGIFIVEITHIDWTGDPVVGLGGGSGSSFGSSGEV